MINGKEKHWDSREWGRRREVAFFLNVCDHVHLMKKAKPGRREENKQTKKEPEWVKEGARPASCKDCLELHMWPDVFRVAQASSRYPTKTAHLRTPHISHAWQKSAQPGGRNSALCSAPLCSANPWWHFQVAHKRPLAPQSHPFDCAFLRVCLCWLYLQYRGQTWAKPAAPQTSGQRDTHLSDCEWGHPLAVERCVPEVFNQLQQSQITVMFNKYSDVLTQWLHLSHEVCSSIKAALKIYKLLNL